MPIKFRSAGRGRYFSKTRAVVEAALNLTCSSGWPGRLWQHVPRADRLSVHRFELPLLPASASPRRLRVAFASDFHIGPTTPPVLLDQAFAAIAGFAPDLLLLGGDYVYLDATRPRVEEIERRLAGLSVPAKLAVLGNHDLWTDHFAIERALERGGARVLINHTAFLPAPFDDVAVVGLDEPWTGAPDIDAALAGSENARLRIGLCHSPDGCAYFSGKQVSLLLCGHTHGGQIALPSGPIYLPPGPYSRRYPHGLHEVDDLLLFVSRGVGTTELPIRVFAPADVALFELTEGAAPP